MASLPKIIDLEDAPDLLRLVQEVRETHDEVVIRQGGEDVAVISPVKSAPSGRPKRVITAEDIEAFRSAFGGWKDIDTDRLLADIYADRDLSVRPPIDL